jgi:Protein of unknown function (DUF3795)
MKQQKEKYPNERICQGCKLGYASGKRDLSKAKCLIKVCCLKVKELATCIDCPGYPCQVLGEFWSKKGWKYKQYRKQLEFIKQYGYEEFLKRADLWKGPCGRLKNG